MGKAMPDRFSGGMQLTVQQIWSLEQARCRFGKYLRVPVQLDSKNRTPDVARFGSRVSGRARANRTWRAREGLVGPFAVAL